MTSWLWVSVNGLGDLKSKLIILKIDFWTIEDKVRGLREEEEKARAEARERATDFEVNSGSEILLASELATQRSPHLGPIYDIF